MQLQDAVGNYVTANTTITTTTETVSVTSPLAHVNRNSAIVLIMAYAELTLGTNTTAITQGIRRGTAITDTLVNEQNANQIQTAAGSSEHYSIVCFEQLQSEQVVQYVHTLKQTAATGNGTILSAGIAVLII